MAAVYAVYTSPTHTPVPNHLPTLIVTPHGQPSNILYSYLHTNFNAENYLLTPSPQGDLCVAKLFPPRPNAAGKASASDPGHGSATPGAARLVRCEASRNLKWSITNTGVIAPIYKLALPSPDGPDLPLFQISKPNPNAAFWSMFYFAYAGHNIPPKRIEFGKIQKNPPGQGGGGTRISITGKTPEEKAVWQTLGEGNEDCVEWVVLCAVLNLLDDEIMKVAEKNPMPPGPPGPGGGAPNRGPVSLSDGGPVPRGPNGPPQGGPPPPGPGPQQGPPPPHQGAPPPQHHPNHGPQPPHQQGQGGPRPPPPQMQMQMPMQGMPPPGPGRGGPPPPGWNPQQQGYPSPNGPGGPPPNGVPRGYPPPGPGGPGAYPPQMGMGGPPPGQVGYRGPPPPGHGGPPPPGHGAPMPRGMPNGSPGPGYGGPPPQQQLPPQGGRF